MRAELLSLLREISDWAESRGVLLECFVLGGGALRLFWEVGGRTKDLDLVAEPLGENRRELEEVFGISTGRDPYLDLVAEELPLLPSGWRQRATEEYEGTWKGVRVHRLAPLDMVASELRAFRPQDRRDIQTICDLHPEVRRPLASLDAESYWMAPDIWEDRIEPNRDRVLAWLDGRVEHL